MTRRVVTPEDVRKNYGYGDIAHRTIQWGLFGTSHPLFAVRLPLDDTPSPPADVFHSTDAALRRFAIGG